MLKKRILVVEDETIIAKDIRRSLDLLGYEVTATVSSGQEALQSVNQNKPDLVLMDIMIHGSQDGIETADAIKHKFDIPVVYLTAYADEQMLERAKITEPFGYILKPFEETELRTTIEIALYKHKLQSRLKESQRWLSTVLMSIGDAIIATDREGCIVFINPVATLLTGYTQEKALGKHINNVLKLEGQSRVENFCAVNMNCFKTDMKDMAVVSKTGDRIYINGCVSPIIDETGALEGTVVAFRDVTEKKLYEENLNNQRESFISVLLHDLKTPVIAINGYSNRYLEGKAKSDKEKTDALRVISDASRDILNVIEVTTHSLKNKNSLMAFNPRELKFNELLASVLSGFIPEMERRSIKLTVNDNSTLKQLEETSISIMGDYYQVKTMTENLISNAVKYASNLIKVKLHRIGTDVFLSVEDDGRGIAQCYHDKVFEEYFQAPESLKGTGLGLYSVKRVVEKHEGTISLMSVVEKYTRFEIKIPCIK
ncbi:hybrid sensor histidine kinase/response regulator [Candidatus Magnetomonas plexicatena]|uniref:hybrid sensor histidine kinase/response regulator n=1 Tax=Candidatus Magnetomonas plexicatena TaxID=2552947 RepID=UPI001C76BE37|nr:response regulator [Nitrospirales bacterium LBB_01]